MKDSRGVAKLLEQHYGARLTPQAEQEQSMMGEFVFMLKATRFIMAQSTFSWWCAFLSTATEIYFPLVGDWWNKNPRFRLYVNEDRYVGVPETFGDRRRGVCVRGKLGKGRSGDKV